jgi:hypothetical protein
MYKKFAVWAAHLFTLKTPCFPVSSHARSLTVCCCTNDGCPTLAAYLFLRLGWEIQNYAVRDLVVSATQLVVYVLKGHDFSRAVNNLK